MFNRNRTPRPLIGHGAIGAGRRWRIGIAMASGIVIAAGLAMTALALRGQTVGSEGTYDNRTCQELGTCGPVSIPAGIVAVCSGPQSFGDHCATLLDQNEMGICGPLLTPGTQCHWVVKYCYTFEEGFCDIKDLGGAALYYCAKDATHPYIERHSIRKILTCP